MADTDATSRLRRWLAPLGADLPPLFVVGGAVRDHLLGRPYKDLDLICPQPEALARRLGRIHQAAVVPFLKKVDAPCHRVVSRADPGDFLDLSPIAGGSVEADLARRDVTVNAMALPVLPGNRLGALIDPLGGRPDLAGRIIRACGPDAFRDDPVRILRAVRIAAQLGFVVEPATLDLARKGAAALAAAAVERIVKELFDLLAQPASGAHIRTLDDLGALEAILPEIRPLKGCGQNAYHHLDVWGHSLAALDRLEVLLADPSAYFGMAAGAVVDLLSDRRLSLLKLACLLHDLGKPTCRQEAPEDKRVHFYGHDKCGATLAEAVARRLKLSVRDRERLVLLVSRHMQAGDWSKPEVRPGTLIKWSRRLGGDMVLLILLGMADTLAKRGSAADAGERRRRLQWGRETLETYFETVVPSLSAPPLITGDDLLALGLAPGPRIGEILARVTAARDAGQIATRREALEMARKAAGQQGPQRSTRS
jgi:tRNA nucleotidyltransferase/poly(A) polymerase